MLLKILFILMESKNNNVLYHKTMDMNLQNHCFFLKDWKNKLCKCESCSSLMKMTNILDHDFRKSDYVKYLYKQFYLIIAKQMITIEKKKLKRKCLNA